MNIKEFNIGDIITRNEGMKYSHMDSVDGSWLGERFILRGHDEKSKIFFIEHTTGHFNGDITDMSYGRDPWDEGWCLYPETLWQSIKKSIKK